ncbi:hypothetical protein AK812_SmicGene29921 [Symbiodinium microadriaticum]|uniref:Uncharacterized protein n=1 Tax=Symbiodinium microadriaticum TaxID=2951 RepID=A0A1Q9D0M7_SYMMI|nr:hypothetical protein AK812_SmicGene29921 [Symbiodinium microadriaticum]
MASYVSLTVGKYPIFEASGRSTPSLQGCCKRPPTSPLVPKGLRCDRPPKVFNSKWPRWALQGISRKADTGQMICQDTGRSLTERCIAAATATKSQKRDHITWRCMGSYEWG